jgi:thiamine-monophosphate kinase
MAKKINPESGEERLIERFFRPLATAPGALGLVDDAALLAPPAGCDLVLTVDTVVAGVHFFADDAPADLARKALRVNLSDLAAKGAEPLGCLLALSLPENTGEEWLAAFARGLGEDCANYRCPLLGGDTTKTPALLTISVTAFGAVPSGKMVKRSGAHAGDVIAVTGTVGDAALGLKLRREPEHMAFGGLPGDAKAHLAGRYLLPQPRTALAAALRDHATAAIDVSDGLAGDLMKLAAASGVAARVEAKRVPLSPAARSVLAAEPKWLEAMLTGGDDYEVLATVPEAKLKALQAAGAAAGIEVTAIGRIEAGEGVEVLDAEGRAFVFARPSFSHF